MNFSDLQQSNINDDLTRRRQIFQDMSDKELVAQLHPVNDYRNTIVIKNLLRERGISGVPE